MFLGIDLGTSEVKVLLLDEQHRIVATAGQPLAIRRPRPGWSEQDPADWWTATEGAVRSLAAAQPGALAAVRGMALAGQMHGAVLLDAAGAVLRPSILWNDGRSQAECAEMEAQLPKLRAITGNMAMPGFTAPKLWWLRRHEPEVFARVATVLLPKDWLRWRMTGERVSDLSDASGTLWLDVGARTWSPELLEASGLSAANMPRLVEGSDSGGTLRADVAAAWGLPPGIPLAGGAGDNAASAIGVGAVRANQGFVSLGTSGVIFRVQDHYEPRPDRAVHTYCHAIPATWHQMSVMLSAGSALRWACRLLGSSEAPLLERVSALDETALREAPLFLPYLDGERTPHNDANARGMLFGLGGAHDAASVAYAVLEGVAFGLRDGWDAMGGGPPSEPLLLVGGGARSALWARLIASALDVPLQTCEGGEAGGALGAARLAWLAAGGELAEVSRRPALRDRFDPEPLLQARLAPRHERFRNLYARVKDLFPPAAIQ